VVTNLLKERCACIFRVEGVGGKCSQMFVTTYEIMWPNHGIINLNVIKNFMKFDIQNLLVEFRQYVSYSQQKVTGDE
jgi:hypothetical protein